MVRLNMSGSFIRKHVPCLVIVVTLTLILMFYNGYVPTSDEISSRSTNTHIEKNIIDILDDEIPPKSSIFFIESSELLGKKEVIDVNITFRRACTVESIAKIHPDLSIFIVYTTAIKHPESTLLETPEYAALKQIYKFKNVHIRSMNVSRFIKHTPVESVFTSGKFNTSKYPSVHLSDILRVVVLWRYGGTYLDLDMILTKSLQTLGSNYLVLESSKFTDKVNNAQISLENSGIGREITESCMKELAVSFNGLGWAENGPHLLSRVVSDVCGKPISSIRTPTDCKGLKIHPHWIFNPYDWSNFSLPFRASHTKEGLEIMKRSYGIHVYGHSSNVFKIYKNQSFVLYAEMAKQFCPASYYNSGDYF